jgi:hypothetical protein
VNKEEISKFIKKLTVLKKYFSHKMQQIEIEGFFIGGEIPEHIDVDNNLKLSVFTSEQFKIYAQTELKNRGK